MNKKRLLILLMGYLLLFSGVMIAIMAFHPIAFIFMTAGLFLIVIS